MLNEFRNISSCLTQRQKKKKLYFYLTNEVTESHQCLHEGKVHSPSLRGPQNMSENSLTLYDICFLPLCMFSSDSGDCHYPVISRGEAAEDEIHDKMVTETECQHQQDMLSNKM